MNTTHDDDQLSTKPIRRKQLEIMETGDFRRREVIGRNRVLRFIFNCWSVIIYVSFRI